MTSKRKVFSQFPTLFTLRGTATFAVETDSTSVILGQGTRASLCSRVFLGFIFCSVWASFPCLDEARAQSPARDPISLTHGPMLGQPTATSMVVWGRTSDPGEFTVHYGTHAERLDQISQPGTTAIERDNTGTVQLVNLQPDTRYHYQIWVNERPHGLPGSFRTLPSAELSQHAEHNPNGLFNFRFQIGCSGR